jgi:putative ABC transport system ATP-binding protein
LIDVHDVEFAYRTGAFRLRVPELRVEAGEAVAVVGPSGSGKTTLLRLVAGIHLPDRGTVRVDQRDVHAMGDAARRDFRIRRIGLVFQEFELLDYLDVLENVLLPYRITGALRIDRAVRERAARLVEGMGLGDKLRRRIGQLSQGERQRVAVCRALLTEPALLLADEPTGNLDPANKGLVLSLLLAAARESGATLLTVTHDHALLDRFDRIVDVEDWGDGSSTTGEEARP